MGPFGPTWAPIGPYWGPVGSIGLKKPTLKLKAKHAWAPCFFFFLILEYIIKIDTKQKSKIIDKNS